LADTTTSGFAVLPSVERVLTSENAAPLIARFGRAAVTAAVRAVLDELRAELAAGQAHADGIDSTIGTRLARRLEDEFRPSLRPIFNLTGTVLHTNLGRAPLPREAVEAMALAAGASNLEYDLDKGARGDRDDHVERLLAKLTSAEAATVVNNNAAAVLLVLNSLAPGKEVPVSRGELIEIGGSFRMPDIMVRAGCRLREVGTTNRTHLADYAGAIGPKTALVMKVHASNYTIEGFTAAPDEAALARLCHERGLPFVVDLGSGALIDLERFGLPHERTPMETLGAGADLVTFSGDKLLGGPQAGIVVGRADLVARIKRNPMKRALRLDKMTIAALAAVLRLYADPERLASRLPTVRALARPLAEIRALAERLAAPIAVRLPNFNVAVVPCDSQIGSGALPTQRIASAGVAITPTAKRGTGAALARLAASFRALPMPVIGRVHESAFVLDLRCLEDEVPFLAQLASLTPP
jgi:L-seryl-tRNA(Ser) seleniumtransferase